MNYKEVEQALTRLDQFKHGASMSARYTTGWYRVYSYNTEIARYSVVEDVWYVNTNKYSSTTSRQQGIVRRVIANLDHQTYELLEV